MRKFIFLALFLIPFMTALLVSCDSDEPENDEVAIPDSDGLPDDNQVIPDDAEDCNYSSADNRLKPKNDEVVFSGLLFKEKSLTKFTYVMNRCYTCNDSLPLIISSMTIVDDKGLEDPGYFVIESNPVSGGPVSLKNNEEIGIGISTTAETWDEHVRYLRIKSNDKCNPNFDLKLVSQTKPTGRIVVKTVDDADPLDEIMVFSEVQTELINNLNVENEGTATLKLLSVSITSGKSKSANEKGFFINNPPEPSVQIAPKGMLNLEIGCRNDKEYPEPLTGELLIENDDPTDYSKNQDKKVILKCGPDVDKAPKAVLKCEPEKISVLQWATMDGSDSVDSDGTSKEELKYLWTTKTTPGGITTDIVDDLNRAGPPINNNPTNEIARAAFQAKMKGIYVIRLIVINNKGISSIPAECTVEAISDDDLAVKLLWDNKNADMDIHLVRPDGTYGDPVSDCYFWNCSPQYSGARPDWGVEGEEKDDPYLDLDNTTGMGPETLYVNKPANGTYKVVVHAYDTSKGPTTAVVKAYVHSVESAVREQLMTTTDTCWDVYTIDVSDGDGTKKNLVVHEVTGSTPYECARPSQN